MASPFTKLPLRDVRLERAIQKLEEACDRVQSDQAIVVLRRDPVSAKHVPQRIREIIEDCLLEERGGVDISNGETFQRGMDDGYSSLAEENKLLEGEVKRVEALLRRTRFEREDLGEKYVAVTSKLESALRLDKEVEALRQERSALMEQMKLLQRQMAEKEARHQLQRRQYEEAQERQAFLVQKLQAKLLQYKKRNIDLEIQGRQASDKSGQLELSMSSLEAQASLASLRVGHLQETHSEELQTTLLKLDQEEKNNSELKSQLSQSKAVNQRLTADVHKLTADWTQSRELLIHKDKLHEDKLKVEISVAASEFRKRVSMLLPVLSSVKSHFIILKSKTEEDLALLQQFFHEKLSQLAGVIGRQESLHGDVVNQWHLKCERKERELRQISEELNVLKIGSEETVKELNERVSQQEFQLVKRGEETERLQGVVEGHEHTVNALEAELKKLSAENEELQDELRGNQDRRQMLESSCSILQEALKKISNSMRNQTPEPTLKETSSGSSLSDLEFNGSPVGGGESHGDDPDGDSGVESVAYEAWNAVKLVLTSHSTNVQELERQIGQLQRQLQASSRQLEATERERSALAKAIDVLKVDLETSQRDQVEWKSECKKLETKCSALTDQLEDEKSCRPSLEQRLEMLQTKLNDLSTENAELHQSRQSLSETTEKLKEKLTKAENRLISKRNKIDKLKKEVTETEQRSFSDTRLEVESIEKDDALAQISSRLDSLCLSLGKSTTEKTCEAKLVSLQKAIKAQRECIEKCELEKTALRVSVQQLEVKAKTAEAQVCSLEQGNEQLAWTRDRLSRERVADERQAGEYTRLRDEEVSELRTSLLEAQQEMLEKEEVKGKIGEEIALLQEQTCALKKELISSRGRLSQLEAELRGTVRERDALVKRVEVLKAGQSEGEAQVTVLQKRGKRLQEKLEKADVDRIQAVNETKLMSQAKRKLGGDLRESAEAVADLKTRLRRLESVERDFKLCRSEWEEERRRFVRLVEDSTGRSVLSQNMVAGLQGEKEALQIRNDLQDAQVKEMQERCVDLEMKLRSLKEEHTTKLFELEVTHESKIQKQYEKLHRSESETVDKLRQKIRELEAKLVSLQCEVAERKRKKRQYCSDINKKDKEVKELRFLLGESLQHMVDESTLTSRDSSLKLSKSGEWRTEHEQLSTMGLQYSRVPKLHVTSPIHTSTPRKT